MYFIYHSTPVLRSLMDTAESYEELCDKLDDILDREAEVIVRYESEV